MTSEGTGQTNLGQAAGAFENMLKAGRQQTAMNAAPAINTALSGADTTRRQEAASGTGRGGGTAEQNREQTATTTSNIDNIIAQELGLQQTAGAQGLATIGGTQLSNAVGQESIGEGAQSSALSGALNKEAGQTGIFGGLASDALTLGLGKALGLFAP